MNMVIKSTFALLVLLGIGFSSGSSVFSSKDYPQFLPKIQAESSSYKEIYRSARIYVEINSMSEDLDDLLEDLEDSAYKATEILSQVLFVKPQAKPLKLGEKNLCKGIQLDNYMKLEEIEADLVVFFSISDTFIQNSTSFKACEFSSDNQLKSIEIKVDRKIYQGFDEDKKVSLLNRAIINAIFNGESQKYAKELEESLENLKYQPLLLVCHYPCMTCAQTDFCLTCSDTVHMSTAPGCFCPPNSALTGPVCVCNTGYYFSSNTVCSACATNCATCSNSNSNCLTCIDSIHMSAAPACSCPANSALIQGSCICNSGYFYSSSTTCTACNQNCNTCQNSAANCLMCSDPTHMSAAPACACPANSSIIGGFCICNPGYYYTSNTVCSACNPQCATCTVDSNECSSCTDQVHSSGIPNCNCPANSVLTAGSCVCNAGYYFSSNTYCAACQTNCETCSSGTACLSCIDPIHMTAPNCQCPNVSSLKGNSCVCTSGFYFSSANTCSPCQGSCATCDTSPTTCDTCTDTVHMAPPSCSCPSNSHVFAGTCFCNTGYYFSSNTECSPCQANCFTCGVSASSCWTCVDTTHMSAAPSCSCPSFSSLSGSSCVCNSGYYYSSATVCSTCPINCATCNIGTACLTCIDTVHMSAAPTCACPSNSILSNGSCTCIAGYFYNSTTTCAACNNNCATCHNTQANCDSCTDTTHMTPAPNCSCPSNGYLAGKTCACSTGYYFSSATVCSVCQYNCATCDIAAHICLTCKDATHMSPAPSCACPANSAFLTSGNTCVCNFGYFYSSNTICSACQNNCQSCTGSAGNCLSCIDTVHMSAAPSCACPANAYQNGNICQCNTGYYYSSASTCSRCPVQCATCDTNPNTCDTCIDPIHMSAAPTCQCPAQSTLIGVICVCNPGYYYTTATTCSQCPVQCATCDTNPNTCDTCIDPIHMSAAPACQCPAQSTLTAGSCVCNPGYYYSSAYICSPIPQCPPQCAQCSSNNFCTACNDPGNMYLNTVMGTCRCWDPYASFNQTSGTCQCIQGYYLSSSGVCQMCMPPCAQCSTSATFCTECDDFANMNLNITTGSCECKNSGSQFNPWVKACQTSSSCNCTSCETIIYNNYNNITNINITNIYPKHFI